MPLKSEIVNVLQGRNRISKEIEEKQWKALQHAISRLSALAGRQEGRDLSFMVISHIVSETGMEFLPDEIVPIIGELVRRKILKPKPWISQDSSEEIYLEQGQSYNSLIDVLSGKECAVNPETGLFIRSEDIFLTFEVCSKDQ